MHVCFSKQFHSSKDLFGLKTLDLHLVDVEDMAGRRWKLFAACHRRRKRLNPLRHHGQPGVTDSFDGLFAR